MGVIFWTIVVSLTGIAIGSFLNVVVFRTQENEPLTGRSKCRTCLTPVATFDLIPIVSFFALKGRCRHCSSVIEWQYPLIELVTGLLFGLLYIRAVLGIGIPDFVTPDETLFLFIRDAVIACFLLIIFVYDFRYSYILDRFSVPAMLIALLMNVLLGASPTSLLLGGFFIASFFAFQFIVSGGKWVGGGDIRMGMLMGLYLGLELGLVALFLSYILGAVVGIFLIAFKKRKADSHVPFGTFMAVASVASLFFGQALLDWYLGFFM